MKIFKYDLVFILTVALNLFPSKAILSQELSIDSNITVAKYYNYFNLLTKPEINVYRENELYGGIDTLNFKIRLSDIDYNIKIKIFYKEGYKYKVLMTYEFNDSLYSE